jgi:hypothetical protein
MRWLTCTAVLVVVGLNAVLSAQSSTDLITPPANVLLPNYNSVPLGPNAGLEGGAYTARVGDPSAAWLNPAGLSRGESSELSGSSGLYQLASVSPSALPDAGGSIQQLPSLVGFTVAKLFGGRWTAGLAVLTANSWTQQTDSQLVVTRPVGQERFAYSADSEFQQLVGVVSMGYVSGRWRAGAGLALVHTNISRNEVISDRLVTTEGLGTALIDSRVSGTAIQLRPVLGMQFDSTEHLRLGAMVRTPAITLTTGGTLTAEAIAERGSSSQGASFFDANAEFTSRLPFEVHGGVAYVAPRVELEVDVHGFTPITDYSMLTSNQPIVSYVNPGSGAPPVITTRPFDGFRSQFRGVANVSFGGHVALTADRMWRLHFGTETDLSPVGAEDQVFTHVNLYGWTVGLSGTKGKFQFTGGLNYRNGTSDTVTLHDLETGEPVQSVVKIRTLGLIYALSYKF